MRPYLSTLFAAAAMSWLVHGALAATSGLETTWLVEDGTTKIRFEPCGADLCGRIVWLQHPNDRDTGKPVADKYNPDPALRSRPLLGLVIFTGLRPVGANEWKGTVYNAGNGGDYEVTLRLDEQGRAEVEGCGLMGLVCQTQTWTRAN